MKGRWCRDAKDVLGELLADLPEKVELAVRSWESGDQRGFAEAWRVVRNRVYAVQNVFDQGHFALKDSAGRG